MRVVLILAAAAQAGQRVADPMVGRYFTEVQAQRGEALFNRNCSFGHTVTSRVPTLLKVNGL